MGNSRAFLLPVKVLREQYDALSWALLRRRAARAGRRDGAAGQPGLPTAPDAAGRWPLPRPMFRDEIEHRVRAVSKGRLIALLRRQERLVTEIHTRAAVVVDIADRAPALLDAERAAGLGVAGRRLRVALACWDHAVKVERLRMEVLTDHANAAVNHYWAHVLQCHRGLTRTAGSHNLSWWRPEPIAVDTRWDDPLAMLQLPPSAHASGTLARALQIISPAPSC